MYLVSVPVIRCWINAFSLVALYQLLLNKDAIQMFLSRVILSAKSKVINLANHKVHRQSSEQIKTRSNNVADAKHRKKVQESQNWVWFYF